MNIKEYPSDAPKYVSAPTSGPIALYSRRGMEGLEQEIGMFMQTIASGGIRTHDPRFSRAVALPTALQMLRIQ